MILTDRPRDHMFKGKGVLVRIDGELIQGCDTDFVAELKPGDTIKTKLHNIEYIVETIMSPTIVRVQTLAVNETQFPVDYHILPKIAQDQMFAQVFERLEQGEAIAIFPEAGSHDQTELLPLKAGACVFVYGTYKLHRQKASMVKVGINYFGGHKFRSKVVINIGRSRTYSFDDSQIDSSEYKKNADW